MGLCHYRGLMVMATHLLQEIAQVEPMGVVMDCMVTLHRAMVV